MAIAAEFLEVPTWKIILAKCMTDPEKFQNGQISIELKEIANTFMVPFGTVQTSYYRFKSKGVPDDIMALIATEIPTPKIEEAPPVTVTEEIKVEVEETQANSGTITTEELGDYVKGSTIECKVIRIEPRYVIVETTDGFRTEGMIHISNMRPRFVSDPNKFFMVNDIVRASIIDIDKSRGYDHLKLSTKSSKLPEYGTKNLGSAPGFNDGIVEEEEVIIPEPQSISNSLGEKLGAVKDKIQTVTGERSTMGNNIVATRTIGSAPMPAVNKSELEQIRGFLKPILGDVSEAAEQAMVELITKHGMFKFTMSMAQVVPGFKPDLGLILAKEIDTKIGGCL